MINQGSITGSLLSSSGKENFGLSSYEPGNRACSVNGLLCVHM